MAVDQLMTWKFCLLVRRVRYVTKSLLTVNVESKNESDALEYALNNKDLHDFTIKMADKVIYANKIVLYCRSSFFRELFEKDLSQNDIALDVPYELFYPLVRFLNVAHFRIFLIFITDPILAHR
jgi:hypothetical protein